MPRLSRPFAVLLLVLLLLPAALQAAGPARNAIPLRGQLPSSVWAVLAQMWSLLTGAQGDNGCEFDPSGRCLPHASATVDNGCEFDPNGRCLAHASATIDNGCEADPDGRCRN